MTTTFLVDGHVHYHSCFGVARFLQAARSNFQIAKAQTGAAGAIGCLMFTESSWHHCFRAFAEGLVAREAPGWTLEPTDEDCSLLLRFEDEDPLLLVAGRQIVTAERLEVLALATTKEYEDGMPFPDAVDAATSSGAITVVPWGFGKWTGRRGGVVKDLLESERADRIHLGDNGGRPGLALEPSLFQLARSRGVPILPGSDPLPIPAEVGKPGRYGFVLEGLWDSRAPAQSIRDQIATRSQPTRFGRLEGLPTFFLRQARLRMVKGRGGSGTVADREEAPRP